VIVLRATALIAVASLGLHQLRYLLGYGSHAHDALAAQGHAYLSLVGLAGALVLALAAAQLMAALSRAWRTGAGEGAPPPVGLVWLAASVSLAGVYTGQELLEAALSAGHPGGVAALTAHGGLMAYPLAVVIGLVVALALRGAAVAVAAVARRRRSPASRERGPSRFGPVAVDRRSRAALAGGVSPRAPPAPC
jgi:hypothetical protein